MIEYYPMDVIFGRKTLYLLWCPDEVDELYRLEKVIPAFASLQDLENFAQINNLHVESDQIHSCNLDKVIRWFAKTKRSQIDCEVFLNAWNLFIDVTQTLKLQDFEHRNSLTEAIYNKLFWGSNLPAMTPEGEHFTPIWRHREVKLLRKVLRRGTLTFERYVSVTHA